MTATQQQDPFDSLLTLEDTLYTSAYDQGTRDGAHAGRIEGRIFGLEKGFDKFAALGALHGRAVVWESRQPSSSPRLKNNIQTLLHLTDPQTFSTLNTDDAVADYDDRFKRAAAKCKIIQRTVGSIHHDIDVDVDILSHGHGEVATEEPLKVSSLPTATKPKARRIPRKHHASAAGASGTRRQNSDNMEDFSLHLNQGISNV